MSISGVDRRYIDAPERPWQVIAKGNVNQSIVKMKTSGTIADINYSHIDYASHSNGDLIYLMHGLGRVKLWQGSVGVGYAYNWVPVRGLLINVMAMPMLTFVNKIKAYGYATNVPELLDDPRVWDDDIDNEAWDEWWDGSLRITPMGKKTFNSGVMVNFDARLSLTYNFGRYFVNAYGQFNNFRYQHSNTHGYLNDWFVNTSIGIRL